MATAVRGGIPIPSASAANRRIADSASEARRIGARALKDVYGRIIKPFEFDPFSRDEVRQDGSQHRLVIDDQVVVLSAAGKPVRRLSLYRADVGLNAIPERGRFLTRDAFRPSDLPTVMRKAYNLASEMMQGN